MDQITRDELKKLMEMRGDFHASLYIPTVRSGDQVDQNAIRFKNRIQDLEKRMENMGARKNDLDEYLKPLWDLQQDHDFWQFQSDGLAVFNSPGFLAYYRVPVEFDEFTVLTDRFHLKPLLHMFSEDGIFYVLALSQGQTQLYRCNQWSIEPVEVEDMPENIDETTMFDVEQKTVRGREGATSAASVWHGQGRGEDKHIETLRQYARDIDKALEKHIDNQRTPLVLACVDYLAPIFHDATKSARVLEKHVSGNPDHLNEKQLHEKAWEVIEPFFRREREQARDKFNELVSADKASSAMENVIKAAFRGRVDTLFVADDKRVWGFYHPDTDEIEQGNGHEAYDEDLLDFAALQTVAHGGSVYVMPDEQIPGDSHLAAVYRF